MFFSEAIFLARGDIKTLCSSLSFSFFSVFVFGVSFSSSFSVLTALFTDFGSESPFERAEVKSAFSSPIIASKPVSYTHLTLPTIE